MLLIKHSHLVPCDFLALAFHFLFSPQGAEGTFKIMLIFYDTPLYIFYDLFCLELSCPSDCLNQIIFYGLAGVTSSLLSEL